MIALNGISFWLGLVLVSITTPGIVIFLVGITRLARHRVNRSRIGALRSVFSLEVALFGLGLILVGYNLVEARFDFLGGFLLVIGIQTFCWVIGIRLEILGNVTDDVFDRQGEAEDSRHASSAIQQ